jgi:hypothetical protein
MSNRLLFLIFLVAFFNSLQGQEFCGTSYQTQEEMKPQPTSLKPRNSVTYVPVRIHLVGDNEGNGIPSPSRLLDQMTRLNRDFEGTGIQFYMSGSNFFNTINDVNVYEEPNLNVQDILRYKSPNAMNVFVTKNTYPTDNGGSILGYYTGLGTDHIVMLNSQLSSSNNTLSHEVGHFFNLRHTFFGWEQEPYNAVTHGNPLTIRLAPKSNAAIELMDKSNCSTAADQLCDTPPDYNFGFTANGCNFNQQIKDINNELIVTQKENQMSYFNNCSKYVFTSNQITRMSNSLMSTSRSYIRLNYTPNTAAITGTPSFVNLQALIPTYNNVLIQWTPVENATNFVVEITDGRSTRTSIQNGTSLRATDLEANKTYIVRVRPFNEYFTDTKILIGTFKTGNVLSSVNNDELDMLKVDLIGNPVFKGSQDILFNINSTMNFDAAIKVFDVQGKMIHIETKRIENGTFLHRIPATQLSTGLHILSIESEYGRIVKKIMIN